MSTWPGGRRRAMTQTEMTEDERVLSQVRWAIDRLSGCAGELDQSEILGLLVRYHDLLVRIKLQEKQDKDDYKEAEDFARKPARAWLVRPGEGTIKK